MLNAKEQLERLREIAAPVCAAHGLALVDARFASEHGGLVLRVLIERPDQASEPSSSAGTPSGAGVSLADCQAVSRDLSTLLDVEDPDLLPGRYRLEVGSPGLDRPLLTPQDFQRFAGREVRVRTNRAVAGRKQIEGVLQGLAGDCVKLRVALDHAEQELVVPLDEITKANLVFRF
jgi:ribosome maturation factor RimP